MRRYLVQRSQMHSISRMDQMMAIHMVGTARGVVIKTRCPDASYVRVLVGMPMEIRTTKSTLWIVISSPHLRKSAAKTTVARQTVARTPQCTGHFTPKPSLLARWMGGLDTPTHSLGGRRIPSASLSSLRTILSHHCATDRKMQPESGTITTRRQRAPITT